MPIVELKELYDSESGNVPLESMNFHNIKGFILFGLLDETETSVPLWLYQKLFEWKFDIFDLIENNLAISVEELEENPYR